MEAPRRILYVEDNPTNFRLVERLLRDDGYEVIHAKDGFEGVRKAVEERSCLELILLDINLPGMDGYEAATKLKALPGLDQIPVVAVTVNTLKGDRKRSLAAGCDGYIPKPIDVHTFPRRVEEYIQGRRDQIHASDERYYLREHARRLVDRLESSRDQLRLTHEQIQHKDKLASLGEMAAGIAHELRNPLSSISFAIEMLLRREAGQDADTKHLDLIHRNVERIQRLADGLTSFARPSDACLSDVDVAKALDDSVLVTQHEFRQRNIVLHHQHGQSHLPPVWANEGLLQHAFVNLLRNAAQAVSARREQNPDATGEVHVEADASAGDHVAVTIRDSGIGIRPDYQDRLFTPFFTTKPRGEGTGLGLYIVKQVIDEIGGQIDVHSRMGRGTTFRLLLPRAAAGRSAER